MSKSKSNALATSSLTTGNQDKASFMKDATAIIDKAIAGAKSAVQSFTIFEKLVADAAFAALMVAKQYGNASAADRLVRGIRFAANENGKGQKRHPMLDAMTYELVAWFRSVSPVRWDAKGKVFIVKKGEPGWREGEDGNGYSTETATKEAFNETEQAVKARKAGAKKHQEALKEATFDSLKGRIYGLAGWYLSLNKKGEDGRERPVKKEDDDKIREGIETVVGAFAKHFKLELPAVMDDGHLESVIPHRQPVGERRSARGKAKAKATNDDQSSQGVAA